MAKKISVDELARLTQEGFLGVQRDMVKLDTDLAKGLAGIHEHLEKLASKEEIGSFARNWAGEIGRLDETMKSIDQRLKIVETRRRRSA